MSSCRFRGRLHVMKHMEVFATMCQELSGSFGAVHNINGSGLNVFIRTMTILRHGFLRVIAVIRSFFLQSSNEGWETSPAVPIGRPKLHKFLHEG